MINYKRETNDRIGCNKRDGITCTHVNGYIIIFTPFSKITLNNQGERCPPCGTPVNTMMGADE